MSNSGSGAPGGFGAPGGGGGGAAAGANESPNERQQIVESVIKQLEEVEAGLKANGGKLTAAQEALKNIFTIGAKQFQPTKGGRRRHTQHRRTTRRHKKTRRHH